MATDTIGFLGAGQMARALAQGFVRTNVYAGERVWASDPVAEARTAFREVVPDSQICDNNLDVVAAADTIVLAVKPQQMSGVLEAMAPQIDNSKLVISIAAGVTLGGLTAQLPDGCRLVRVMPNTPCLVGQGASGYALGQHATDADAQLVDRLLATVGKAFRLDEQLLDAVTGLSGSGPAFVCAVLEALCEGAVGMGLPPDVAAALATQTLRGTAEYLQSTGVPPEVLRQRVSSPGGTTVAGLEALETHGLRKAVIAAVEAATKRSIELGQG